MTDPIPIYFMVLYMLEDQDHPASPLSVKNKTQLHISNPSPTPSLYESPTLYIFLLPYCPPLQYGAYMKALYCLANLGIL